MLSYLYFLQDQLLFKLHWHNFINVTCMRLNGLIRKAVLTMDQLQ